MTIDDHIEEHEERDARVFAYTGHERHAFDDMSETNWEAYVAELDKEWGPDDEFPF